jgi:hypothetical protein
MMGYGADQLRTGDTESSVLRRMSNLPAIMDTRSLAAPWENGHLPEYASQDRAPIHN